MAIRTRLVERLEERLLLSATLSYTDTEAGKLPASGSISVPKFDPRLGILESVSLNVVGHGIGGETKVETQNEFSSVVISLPLTASISVHAPQNLLLVLVLPSENIGSPVTLNPFDGVKDFAGPDSFTFTGGTSTDSKTQNLTSPPADLSLFIGSGSLAWGWETSFQSQNNIVGVVETQTVTPDFDFTATVTYTYLPQPLVNVHKTSQLLVDADHDHRISPGDTLEYTFTIENEGGGDSLPIIFTDPLSDRNLRLVSGTVTPSPGSQGAVVTQGNTPGDRSIIIDVGVVAPGSTITIVFDATIRNPLVTPARSVINTGFIDNPPKHSHVEDPLPLFHSAMERAPEVPWKTPLGTITLSPMFTGTAQPGTVINTYLLDTGGNVIGSVSRVVGPGGNWQVSMPETVQPDHGYTLTIRQWNQLPGTPLEGSGYDLRVYFAPAFGNLAYANEQYTTEQVIARWSPDSTGSQYLWAMYGLNLDRAWYESLCSSTVPSGLGNQ